MKSNTPFELSLLQTAIAAFVFGLQSPLLAQSSNSDSSATAPQITISASRNETALDKMPTHTTVISREEIDKSNALSLDQLLRTVQGFNFAGAPSYESDPTGTSTKMRGLGNGKVLILLDGVPIMDPFYQTTQWFRVPLSSVEQVEVMRGGASSLWGSSAVGGVVNIITRKPKTDSGELAVSAGSFGTNSESANKSVVISDALSVNLSVNRFHTNGYQTTPAQYLWMYPGKNPPKDTNTDYQATLFFKPSADNKGFVRVGYDVQDQNLYGVYGRNLQTSPNFSAGLTNLLGSSSFIDTRVWAQNVHFDKTNGASCFLVSGSCKSATSPVTLAQATNTSNPVISYFSQQGLQSYTERGGSSVYSNQLKLGWLENIQLGADMRQLYVNDQETYYKAPVSTSVPENLNGVANGTGRQTFTGLFGQAKFEPADSLQVTTSARLDTWSNTDRSYSLNTVSYGASPGSGSAPNTSKSQFDPSIAFHWDLGEGWATRGNAFRAFRAPGLNNQTRSYGTSIANPNLNPETVNGWELGTDFKSNDFRFGATYFHDEIKNMIATANVSPGANEPQAVINLCSTSLSNPNTANCGGTTVSYYSNNQNGVARGLELNGSWQANRELTFDAFYTLTETYLTSTWNGVSTPLSTQLTGVPRETFSTSSTWKPSAKLTAFAQVYWIGPLAYAYGTTTGAASSMQGSNTLVNASVNYQADSATEIFIRATNLLNKQYQDSTYTASQPQGMTLSPPRTLNVGIRYRF